MIGKQHGLIDQLELVDDLRQLGVTYHFDSEIKNMLTSISSSVINTNSEMENNNLYDTALMFRLLREHAINASALSVDLLMSCFRHEGRSFDSDHEHDVRGMLSLYEASFLAVEGEEDLDEAGETATKFLRNIDISLLDRQTIEQIDHALELPLHWRMPRLHNRWFIDVYGCRENLNPALLELAKLDFNLLQSAYKEELKETSR